MAATVVAMAVGDTQLTVVHAGDSRAYRLRGGELARLTRDHSVVEEMKAARPEMTEAEMAAFAHRNVVTRCLGSKEDVEPGLTVAAMEEGDVYLLCSDGLWGSVPDDRIASIIRSTNDLEAACQLLIDAANEAGGPDNISALLVRVG
jgi:protein phosphatase